jgi:hypothetical protein
MCLAVWPAMAQYVQQGGKLIAADAVGQAGLGSVALSADGNTLVVGGAGDDNTAGAIWIFSRSGGVWRQQGPKLVPSDPAGKAFFGTGVAISADGNTALAGGSGDNSTVGAVWAFVRFNGVWTQQGKKMVGAGTLRLRPRAAWSGYLRMATPR